MQPGSNQGDESRCAGGNAQSYVEINSCRKVYSRKAVEGQPCSAVRCGVQAKCKRRVPVLSFFSYSQ